MYSIYSILFTPYSIRYLCSELWNVERLQGVCTRTTALYSMTWVLLTVFDVFFLACDFMGLVQVVAVPLNFYHFNFFSFFLDLHWVSFVGGHCFQIRYDRAMHQIQVILICLYLRSLLLLVLRLAVEGLLKASQFNSTAGKQLYDNYTQTIVCLGFWRFIQNAYVVFLLYALTG